MADQAPAPIPSPAPVPSPASPTATRIRDRLDGQHILLTGSTGFLAKVFLEKILRSVDTIGGIHLLVRPRSGGHTPKQRVLREVLRSKAYDRLRASLGDGFERLCADKIHVVGGDLTNERLGIDAKTYDELTKQITLVVNSAATVTFDEQLDLAIELNARGPGRLLQFARDCGNVPMMQVSTCYVCGDRSGVVAEEFGVPDRARDKFPRCPDTGAFDLDGLVDSMVRETVAIKERLGAGTEACRRALIETGMQRARLYGWNDTYTFTKWLGEQFLVRDHGDVPVVIFRPAIIESSYEEPMPGWIDGLRMADPVLVAYGRGKLKEFPGLPDVAMDMIPVDFVSNAMIATLPSKDSPVDHVPVYHCASSGRRPCHLRDLRKSLQEAFRRRPMYDDDGKPIVPRRLKLVEKDRFIARWRGRQRRLTWLRAVLNALGITGLRYRRLASVSRQIEPVIELEVLADGRANWRLAAAGGGAGQASGGGAPPVRIDSLVVANATGVFRASAHGTVERTGGLNSEAARGSLDGPSSAQLEVS